MNPNTTRSNYSTTKPHSLNFNTNERRPRPWVEIRVATLERKVREQYHMLLELKDIVDNQAKKIERLNERIHQ